MLSISLTDGEWNRYMQNYSDEFITEKDGARMDYVVIKGKRNSYSGQAKPYGNAKIGVWITFNSTKSLNLFKKSLIKCHVLAEIRVETDSEVVLVVPEQNAREFLRNMGAVRKKVLTVAQREALAKRFDVTRKVSI